MRTFRPVQSQQHTDQLLEEVRRDHARAITELQAEAIAKSSSIIEAVELANATNKTIAHKLGRAPKFVTCSVPRGAASAGYINEVRTGVDRTKFIVLVATDFGATITVDVEVR